MSWSQDACNGMPAQRLIPFADFGSTETGPDVQINYARIGATRPSSSPHPFSAVELRPVVAPDAALGVTVGNHPLLASIEPVRTPELLASLLARSIPCPQLVRIRPRSNSVIPPMIESISLPRSVVVSHHASPRLTKPHHDRIPRQKSLEQLGELWSSIGGLARRLFAEDPLVSPSQ